MFYEAELGSGTPFTACAGELDSWIDATSYRNIPEAKRACASNLRCRVGSHYPTKALRTTKDVALALRQKRNARCEHACALECRRKCGSKPEYPYESGFMVVNMALDKPTAALSRFRVVETPLYSIPNLSDEVSSPLQGGLETIQNRCEAQGRSYYVRMGGGSAPASSSLRASCTVLGFVIWIEDGFDDIVRERRPCEDVTPGLVEVSIAVAVEYSSDGCCAQPTVEVVRSDHYTISGKMYADAAYFVNSGRGSEEVR